MGYNYNNPAFPTGPAANAPMAYASKANTLPIANAPHYPAAACHAPYRLSDTGVILVLFILLVIISRAWCV